MWIALVNRISRAANEGRHFARIGRQAKQKYPQEICGPTLTVGVLGLLVVMATLIPT